MYIMLRLKIWNIKHLILLTWATNTTLNAKKNEIKNEIPSITNLPTTAAFNANINEFKNKIPNITNLPTTTAPTGVENKIPNVSNLVKKTDYNMKLAKLKKKSLLIMIMINILLLKYLVSSHEKTWLQD